MQKLDLKQSLSQRLSPQQIQFMKLLQIPSIELSSRIQQELEENPTLESSDTAEIENDTSNEEANETEEELSLEDYLQQDDISGYKMQGDGNFREERPDIPIPDTESFLDSLLKQLGYLKLSDVEHAIGKQIIGSLDADGYMRRPLDSIVNDLVFSVGLDTNVKQVEGVLAQIQTFEPVGIAARHLQECLLIQLKAQPKDEPLRDYCLHIIKNHFLPFTKRHYQKIMDKMHISKENLRKCIERIVRLNPKPGLGNPAMQKINYVKPDFIIRQVDNQLQVSLIQNNEPHLYVSPAYVAMFENYKSNSNKNNQDKKTVSFIKQKLDSAKWFIDSLKQRQDTLLKTMRAIAEYQKEFFMSLDMETLQPMIIKDISEMIQMDISTVSRVINSKFVQTDIGIYPLKFFFSESISTKEGKQVSNKTVKLMLKKIIDTETKEKPYSDEKLESIFHERGYVIARRTISKYRKQMNIPSAILRKEI